MLPDGRKDVRVLGLVALYAPLAAGLAFGAVRDFFSPTGVIATDFTVYWTGWWLILHRHGQGLYDAAAQRITQQMLMGGRSFEGGLMAFLNPPQAALAGVPLGWLADHAGERAAFAVGAALNVFLAVRLVRLVREVVGPTGRRARWATTLVVLGFFPVIYTISEGQVSLLLAVAAFELHRALESDRPRAAAGWLMVFSIKPQLLPALLLLVAARRSWRVLAHAGVIAAVLVALTTAVLGPGVWADYARHIVGLERYFGTGTPAYMMTARGMLARVLTDASPRSISVAAVAIWLAALAALAFVLIWRPARDAVARRSQFALTVAVTLITSPHLFIQDTAIWSMPLCLQLAAMRERGGRWDLFAAFAASWPLVFAVSEIVDLRGSRPPSLLVHPAMAMMTIAIVVMARWAAASRTPAWSAFPPRTT